MENPGGSGCNPYPLSLKLKNEQAEKWSANTPKKKNQFKQQHVSPLPLVRPETSGCNPCQRGSWRGLSSTLMANTAKPSVSL